MRVLDDVVVRSVAVLDLLAELTHSTVGLHVDTKRHECLVYKF